MRIARNISVPHAHDYGLIPSSLERHGHGHLHGRAIGIEQKYMDETVEQGKRCHIGLLVAGCAFSHVRTSWP